jgi:hypothetical protein
VKIRRLVFLSMTLALVSAACSGSDAAESTAEPVTTLATTESAVTTAPTISAATTTAPTTITAETTATEAAATETTITDTTAADAFVPAAIAAGAFTFLAGTSPRFAVLVSVSTDGPAGPWQAAGDAPGPSLLIESNFWVRFEVQNRSSNATMTELDLSVPGVGDVCPDFSGLGPLGTLECVVGPFTAKAGEREIEFDADAKGFRQGESDESIIDPPLTESHGFDGAPHSFTLLFALDLASLNGALLEGAVTEPSITIEPAGLGFANPVAVDCSDRFPGGFSETGGSPQSGEPPLFAYVITVFNPDGSVAETCSEIPAFESTFKLADDSDISIHYVGA